MHKLVPTFPRLMLHPAVVKADGVCQDPQAMHLKALLFSAHHMIFILKPSVVPPIKTSAGGRTCILGNKLKA